MKNESGKELSSEFFIEQLNCTKEELKKAFDNLVDEGYLKFLISENDEDIKIIKNSNHYKKLRLKEFAIDKYEDNILELHNLIESPINDRQARIILNMANGDIKLIKMKYREALKSQFSDKIGILIKLLQTQKYEPKNEKKERIVKSQINYRAISKLKNYIK
jgi:hypothetical protein